MLTTPTRGFLSYAHEDQETAKRLYADLVSRGHLLWFDSVHFRRDEGVDTQVLNAIRESTYFVLLLTPISVSKEGYIRKEIRLALDMVREFELTSVFIIPVRSSPCQPLESELAGLTQFIDLFPDWVAGISSLSATIPTAEHTALLSAGPHAIQAALCDPSYLQGLATTLRDRSGIAVSLDNSLSKLKRLDVSVVSRKISSMRMRPAQFAACLELHFVENCGALDPKTVCTECGAAGTVIHGTIDIGGKSPTDYNDNYVVWCTNCFWADYSFEIDYFGRGHLRFNYKTNTYE